MRTISLQPDCSNCFGLCCVALPFARSADFALNKEAGKPCPNLAGDFRCGIHGELREQGFKGCVTFDCFGAGQQISVATFASRSWREHPQSAAQMFDAFAIMRQLHESLWYLTEARALLASQELAELYETTARFADLPAEELFALDLATHHQSVSEALSRTSQHVRAGTAGADYRGADLVGAKLAGRDLRGASLRGAYLMAADLSGADLRLTDLLGADLRDATLAGADLSSALFVTQPQLTASRGDLTTKIPPALTSPGHW